MRQSQLFTKTRFEAPKDEVSKNAKLLIRAGFIHKDLAGVYSYLPLGLRTLEKINNIIRTEINSLGAVEVRLASLQNPDLWNQTNRWVDDQFDVWFKTKLKNDTELGLGATHEEPITSIAREYIQSYRDLPQAVFQIQTKFRNETRAKSGILRGREFLMKDLYSFHADKADLLEFYQRATEAYRRIFSLLGLGDRTHLTFASGGAFSKYSHEFQTICESGEDTIYLSSDKDLAVNVEVCTPEVLKDLGLEKEELVPHKAIEVGNIFQLGDRFSKALGLEYINKEGKKQPVIMGCYGIGPSRLLGTIAEVLSDQAGLVWPESVAPFTAHLIELPSKNNQEVGKISLDLHNQLEDLGLETLYDDRNCSAGEKFSDSDLIGLPFRLVVSDKALKAGKVEVKERKSGITKFVSISAIPELFTNYE